MHAFADEWSINAQDLNAKEICLRLNPDLFDVTIFYRSDIDDRLKNKTNIYPFKVPKNKYISLFIIVRELLKENYDIFFYVRPFIYDYIYFLLKDLFKDKKISICTVEGMLPLAEKDYIYEKIVKRNTLKSDYVFSVSKYVADTVKYFYKIDSPVMYVGVDTKKFLPIKDMNKKQKIVVLFVGSFQKRKRPYLVLEAARFFKDVEFNLIGNGPLREDLFAYIEKMKISNVKIIDYVPLDNLISHFQESDIFLFPSVHEGFPKVTIEAASCGLPVIVFGNYKPETVIEGKTGFIVEDFTEMLVRLETLVDDPHLRSEFGENARKHAKIFDWDIIVKMWEKIFLNLIDDN